MSDERITGIPPAEEVNARMVALALSSMATTLENIQEDLRIIPRLVETVTETKGAAILAGNMAARSLNEIEELKVMVGRLAQSVQGLEQASRSLMESVYPTEPPLDAGWAEVVPLRSSMTGE